MAVHSQSVADRTLFSGPWTRRQLIAYIVLLAGLGGAIAGLFMARDEITKRALLLLIGGITVLFGGVVYLIATEDSGTGLVTDERRAAR